MTKLYGVPVEIVENSRRWVTGGYVVDVKIPEGVECPWTIRDFTVAECNLDEAE